MSLPERLALNAWTGGERGVSGPVAKTAGNWGLTGRLPRLDRFLAPPAPADPADWRDPGTGWGLVMADNPALSPADRAAAADAPDAIRALVAARNDAPVLRYEPDVLATLLRHDRDGTVARLNIAGSEFGVAKGRIPRYLLILGSPDAVPWELQYVLNGRFAAGRLHLDGEALEHYVQALIAGWPDDPPDPFRIAVWATDHGPDDMSATMKQVIAGPIVTALRADDEIGDTRTTYLEKRTGAATPDTLRAALAERRPGLVITTSHGKSGIVAGVPPTTAANLGLPVGEDLATVDASLLLRDWDPYGALWYAHACCSAGSSATTVFDRLFEPATDVGQLLAQTAALGNLVAPLPTALLGAARPVRAFIGHVEPTFDWTIQQPEGGQPLAGSLREALYDRQYRRGGAYPIGLALEPYFRPIGSLAAQQAALKAKYIDGTNEPVEEQALAANLSARDRMSTVILGDPAVALGVPAR